MKKASISLPDEIYSQATLRAKNKGLSFSSVMRFLAGEFAQGNLVMGANHPDYPVASIPEVIEFNDKEIDRGIQKVADAWEKVQSSRK